MIQVIIRRDQPIIDAIREAFQRDPHEEVVLRPSAVAALLQEAARSAQPSPSPDESLTLRKFRVALQRIAEGEECECQHDDENCCEAVDEFCPYCIAGVALAGAAKPSEPPRKEKS